MKKMVLLAGIAMLGLGGTAQAGCTSADSAGSYWAITNGCPYDVVVRYTADGGSYSTGAGLSDRIRRGGRGVIGAESKYNIRWATCDADAFYHNRCEF